MPELPEVEIWRRRLHTWAGGRPLGAARAVDGAVVRHKLSTRPSDAHPEGQASLDALVGAPAGRPQRHGKRLGWAFGDRALLVHLGMTGRFERRPVTAEAPKQGRLSLEFGDDAIWFVDGRRFGCVVPVSAADVPVHLHQGTGPDALEESLDGPALAAAMRGRRAVKVVLMDQARVAGLGNIHAAEACFRAGIHPGRGCDTLSADEWTRLAAAVPVQLRETLASVPDDDPFVYVSQGGPNPFSVYGREGEPCPSCDTSVAMQSMGGRSTFWCPSCQPGGAETGARRIQSGR